MVMRMKNKSPANASGQGPCVPFSKVEPWWLPSSDTWLPEVPGCLLLLQLPPPHQGGSVGWDGGLSARSEAVNLGSLQAGDGRTVAGEKWVWEFADKFRKYQIRQGMFENTVFVIEKIL